MENNSDTPDFALAGYLRRLPTAFNLGHHRREQAHGRQVVRRGAMPERT